MARIGFVVVGDSHAVNAAHGDRAFIWDQTNLMRDLRDVLVTDFGLDLTGWTLNAARSFSDDGLMIAGYGTNPTGGTEAWIVSMRPCEDDECDVPEPANLALFGIGLAGLGIMRRRRKAT